MKTKHLRRYLMTAGLVAGAALGGSLHAQSADALIDTLVTKGILTAKEANDLREESDRGFTQGYQVKSGLPDWVTSMKFNGDLRGRFDGLFVDPLVDRNRFRYRLRFGATAQMLDDFEVGFRLTSSEPVRGGGSGGDPISGNTTFTSNASKKFVYLDLAYGKWSPWHNSSGSAQFSLGKMENPFVFSDMIFDNDYTPEGLGQKLTYNLNSQHTLGLNLGEFVLSEVSASNQDPFLFGAQLRLDSTWTPKWQSTLGLSALNITDAARLNAAGSTFTVPDQNAGNQRTPLGVGTAAGGFLQNNFNPIIVDAGLTYNLDSFPAYTGLFPIRLAGDYLNNPAAATANTAYSVGITLGKSGKKGLWDLAYRWKNLEGDAWYEELVDSDFGALYRVETPRSRGASGYLAGTNVRGHVFKATYSPYDSLTLSATYFLTEVIDQPLAQSDPTGRLQVDATWKF